MDHAANRSPNFGATLLTGVAVGVVSYLVAEALVPRTNNPGDHDLLLAARLGFIFPQAVALWLAWIQRSIQRAIGGVVVGVAIGFAYLWLCASRNFLAIMVGFPMLLGGVLAAVLGSNRSAIFNDLALRLLKGLVAGFVLGFVYMLTLNLTFGMLVQPNDFVHNPTPAYVRAMWVSGPIALGLAAGLFFPLVRWAVGLSRVRLIVFEEVKTSNVEKAAPSNSA
jgi:hypothetical protein